MPQCGSAGYPMPTGWRVKLCAGTPSASHQDPDRWSSVQANFLLLWLCLLSALISNAVMKSEAIGGKRKSLVLSTLSACFVIGHGGKAKRAFGGLSLLLYVALIYCSVFISHQNNTACHFAVSSNKLHCMLYVKWEIKRICTNYISCLTTAYIWSKIAGMRGYTWTPWTPSILAPFVSVNGMLEVNI